MCGQGSGARRRRQEDGLAVKANIGAALFSDAGFERNLVLWRSLAATIALVLLSRHHPQLLWLLVLTLPLLAVALVDLVQSEHSLRRNYPASAHIRWFFEWLRPFLRAYV